jgi:hypothetical protein
MSEQTKTATLVKSDLPKFTGTAHLYRCDPPMADRQWDESAQPQEFEYVVVSATNAMFSGPETYIFGANEQGEIIEWGELEGSYRGGLDHEEALRRAGYAAAIAA